MFLAALLALQAVPPPPPGPPPPPQGDVTCANGALAASGACPTFVFFDSGKAEIRREWEPVLDAAAAAARSGSRLLVTGHSDTPGSTATNRRMARSRAEAVAAALVTRGVARSAITIRVAGEEELLVPTAEGVREIQNRRVAIAAQPGQAPRLAP